MKTEQEVKHSRRHLLVNNHPICTQQWQVPWPSRGKTGATPGLGRWSPTKSPLKSCTGRAGRVRERKIRARRRKKARQEKGCRESNGGRRGSRRGVRGRSDRLRARGTSDRRRDRGREGGGAAEAGGSVMWDRINRISFSRIRTGEHNTFLNSVF